MKGTWGLLRSFVARRPGVTALLTWAVSILAGSLAMLLGNFGAPAWVFALTLAWLVTAGLPVLLAVLAVASLERLPLIGVPSLEASLATMAVLSFAAQLAACRVAARFLRRRRAPA